jgi:ABC-type microcin C transport system permease subunit YejE
VALAATLLGGALGAPWPASSPGKLADEVLVWLMGVLDAMPFYLFVAAVAFALQGSPYAMHVGMIATFWTTTARLVRGEVIKLRSIEFVEAAHAIGAAEPVDHLPPHPAEHIAHPAGAGDDRLRHGHQGRGDPVVPRHRHPQTA